MPAAAILTSTSSAFGGSMSTASMLSGAWYSLRIAALSFTMLPRHYRDVLRTTRPSRPAAVGVRGLLLDRSVGQAAHDVAHHQHGQDQLGDDRDDGGGRHLAPEHLLVADEGDGGQGDRLGLARAQQEREGE